MEREITIQEAIAEALEEEFTRNKKLFMLGEEILDLKRQPVIGKLREQFPDNIIRSPVVEEMICGIGAGMTIGGLTPILTFDYAAFLPLALNEIYQLGIWGSRRGEAQGPGVIIRASQMGYYGKGSELSPSYIASILHLPNIYIAVPSRPYFTKGLLKSAIRANRPVVFFEHKKIYEYRGRVPKEEYLVPFGTSTLFRTGNDVTIVSWLYTSYLASQAADSLKKDDVDAEVLSLQTLHPLDKRTLISSVKKTRRAVIVEEDILRGGVGAEIAAQLIEEIPGCIITRVAAQNHPLPPGKYEQYALPSTAAIIEACLDITSKK